MVQLFCSRIGQQEVVIHKLFHQVLPPNIEMDSMSNAASVVSPMPYMVTSFAGVDNRSLQMPLLDHIPNNSNIRLFHAFGGNIADYSHSLFHIRLDDAVPVQELKPAKGHSQSHDCRIHR